MNERSMMVRLTDIASAIATFEGHLATQGHRRTETTGVLSLHILLPSLIAVFDLAIPGALLICLWKSGAGSRVYLISLAAAVALYLVAVTFSVLGFWHAIGVFWPFVYLCTFVIVIAARYRRGLPAQWFPERWTKEFFLAGCNCLYALVWALLIARVVQAHRIHEEALQLSAPLHQGSFLVISGGANMSVNLHTRAVRYALDITQLNSFGLRAPSAVPFPRDVAKYTIYGADVIAPCAGEIIGVESHAPNQSPLHPNSTGFGNYVALYCQGHTVRLLHLRPSSVRVVVGDMVKTRQLLGSVGNSGNSVEPHLHIDAVAGRRIVDARDDGGIQSVPIRIDGRFLIKGDRFTN